LQWQKQRNASQRFAGFAGYSCPAISLIAGNPEQRGTSDNE
jgi:hypothetical protein